MRTDKLCKSFKIGKKDYKVLNDINLSILSGEMCSIVGPSGSGKSTLLSILGLLDNASQGDFEICNTSVKTLSRYQKAVLRNKNIGWIFQNFNLIGDMTIAENIALPLTFDSSIKKDSYQSRIEQVTRKVGLIEKLDNYPSELSGGQQQRVAIARALITEPDILLCDEPTGNLDSQNAELIMELFHQLHSDGRTILLITHSESIANQCQKIYSIVDGQLSLIQNKVVKNVV